MLLYNDFYRKFGVRLIGHLVSPKLVPLELLDLPKQSILHFEDHGPNLVGPMANEFLFRHITRPIPLYHVTKLGDLRGTPRVSRNPVDPIIRKYHAANRRYRRVLEPAKGLADPNTPLVCSYSLVGKFDKYVRNIYQGYNSWWNMATAVWKEAALLANISDRQQFVVIKLPPFLPPVSMIRRAEQGINSGVLKQLNTPEAYFLLELWKWAGENRHESMLNVLKDSQLSKINLVFIAAGKWSVVNLGTINEWRKLDKASKAGGATEEHEKGLEPKVFQLRVFRMMMSLMNTKSATGIEDETEQKENAELKKEEGPAAQVAGKTQAVVTSVSTDGTANKTTKTLPIEAQLTADADIATDTRDTVKPDPKLDAEIEKELEAFEKLMAGLMQEQPEGVVVDQPNLVDADTPFHEVVKVEPEYQNIEDGVVKACERLADAGMCSAAEYRRYMTLAEGPKNIPAPNGQGSLHEFAQVPKEMTVIPASKSFKDIPTVIDKTMLKSSLETFDPHYIKHVFHRDVAAMALNVQNAGIAVTDYKTERVETVAGAHDEITINVTPVEGRPSTLRMKLPALEEDGSYKANNVKYRMRKQRVDLPIRKVAPDKVSLTSYYGKTFVSRSEKRVNNYAEWLCNSVMAKGLDNEDQTVQHLLPGKVFSNHDVTPRLYSTLAMSFRGFDLAGYRWNFDFAHRDQLYDPAVLREYEKEGMVVVGTNGRGQYLVMDRHDALYQAEKGQLTELPGIESMLGLDGTKAPVDFTEIKVMGKTIPVGVVMAYRMGLTKLMELLKVTPRRVPVGTRVGLEGHEYAISFKDETLVFSRDDRFAAMILAGFNEYHRVLKDYDVYEFDRQGVYFNVLEANGLTMRYLREIDLMFQMFIDPITKELLADMKEPTDFRGLLLRSNQMLLTDRHPDEFDSSYLRIRGNERMAGAVYSELVRSIRVHNGRPGKSKYPIDLNPHAVWKNIAQDPSIALVQDINPIENLKDAEAVTYSGVGGRSSRSMTRKTRAFHKNDMGLISEATKDSGDVGINTFTSADPQLTSLRGMSKPFDLKNPDPTALLSTSALLAVGTDRDD